MARCWRLLLLLVLHHNAWAATTKVVSTSATPTKTYCPRFSSYYADPVPTPYVCDIQGTLSKPSPLNAYCGYVTGLGELSASVDNSFVCYRACARDPKCLSFSVDPINKVCYTYGKNLVGQGFVSDQRQYHFFTDIKKCYNCTSSAPPQPSSSCPEPAQPKSPSPSGYTCGQNGSIEYYDGVFAETSNRNDFSSCYRYCVEDFDPLGECTSFMLDGNFCIVFDTSLADQGFKPNKTGNARGWNLRGCFNCNAPPATVSTCKPTATPTHVGVRNGNFQSGTYNTWTPPVAIPTYWIDPGIEYPSGLAPQLVQQSDGNKLVALSAVSNSSGSFYADLEQNILGLYTNDPNATFRYVNFSFDLAIPSYNLIKNNGSLTPCKLYYPAARELILADNKTYRGTTLKTVGPYFVDYTSLEHTGALGFQANCNSDDKTGIRASATFWIDNFRITQHGRDVGT